MTTRQIERAVFNGICLRTTLRRLGKLSKKGWLERELGVQGSPLIWTLMPKASKVLGSDLVYGSINRNTLEHEIKISEVRYWLERNFIVQLWKPGFELKKQAKEARGEYVDYDVIPDGIVLMKSKTPNQHLVFALELELWLKRKKKRYRNIFGTYVKKDSINKLWYLVPSQRMGERLMEIWDEVSSSSQKSKFSWSLIDDVCTKSPLELAIYSFADSQKFSELVQLKTLNDQNQNQKNQSVNSKSHKTLAHPAADGVSSFTGKDKIKEKFYPTDLIQDPKNEGSKVLVTKTPDSIGVQGGLSVNSKEPSN